MQAKNEGRPVCCLCLSQGIINSQVIKQAIKPENTGGIALCLNSPDPSALVLEDEIDSFVPSPLLWIVVP